MASRWCASLAPVALNPGAIGVEFGLHAFASHLTVDLGLDVAQVSPIPGQARITIMFDIYTRLFEHARHARDIRTRMAGRFAEMRTPL